ncbi:unnamed protein product [Fusarium graminearum]|nr:unnamed protein product [Fusarium graminearum]CAG2008362.1 unnamed protein product [Fusarium graminearum]
MPFAIKPQNAPSILKLLPDSLPKAYIPLNTDVVSIVTKILQSFPQVEKHHFAADVLWRDISCVSRSCICSVVTFEAQERSG